MDPNVDQHEVDRLVEITQRLAQIARADLRVAAHPASSRLDRAAATFCGSCSVPITMPAPPLSVRTSRTAAAR